MAGSASQTVCLNEYGFNAEYLTQRSREAERRSSRGKDLTQRSREAEWRRCRGAEVEKIINAERQRGGEAEGRI